MSDTLNTSELDFIIRAELPISHPTSGPLALRLGESSPIEIHIQSRPSRPDARRKTSDDPPEVSAEVVVLGAGVQVTPTARHVLITREASATFGVRCVAPGLAVLYVELLIDGEEVASVIEHILVQ